MRIAMVGHKRVPSREGGIEVVVEELAARMVMHGHSVTYYNRTGHHVSGKEYDIEHLDEYRGIRLKRVPTIDRKGLAAVTSSFFGCLAAAFGPYDVVHIHAEGPAMFSWLPRLTGKRVVLTVHGLDWARDKWKGSFGSWYMHLACYRARPDVSALVHVHSSNAVAVSCMKNADSSCAIPVYTPGYSMRVGELPILPYMTPGSVELCDHVFPLIAERNSVLLANHGPLAVGRSMEEALNIIEEIEDEAKLFLLLGDRGIAMTKAQQDALPSHGLRF